VYGLGLEFDSFFFSARAEEMHTVTRILEMFQGGDLKTADRCTARSGITFPNILHVRLGVGSEVFQLSNIRDRL
jgi:hypothetical protein